ncbi:hypothetical protein BJ546DRAFT_99717 [Cryomyces antarcticus]
MEEDTSWSNDCPVCNSLNSPTSSSSASRAQSVGERYRSAFGNALSTDYGRLRNAGHSTKPSAVLKNIENNLEGSKNIVFSCWTSTLDLFESMLLSRDISYSRIDGKVRLQDRLRIIEEFQDNP